MNISPKLRNQMAKLSREQVKVFEMKTIDGLSTEAISNELNLNTDVVWHLIHQARVNLMKGME